MLKALGAIPVDRSKNNNMVNYVSELFKDKEELFVVFTPEGTRSYNPNWKKGFYYLALKAEVPILLAFIDFPSKTGGFLEVFYPTGNIDEDIIAIKIKLGQFKGRYPEKGIIL
jgi:1-acyl-sn-glycerol-3-phosphate acyltransferase